VFTSTAGVISPSQNGQPSDEYTPRWVDYFTDYERSKALAEKELLKLCQSNSLELVIVNPTRVYGPGLLSDSNGVTRMVKMYLEGRFRLLPGDGTSIGNYVYIDDVVEGHLAAMEKGTPGERYILGGENASFRQFFDILTQVSGKQLRLFNVPVGVMKFAARLMELRADLTGRAPLLTPPWVNKYLYHWELSSKKAAEELGYAPLPLAEGLRRTVEWLQCQEQSKTQR
jgi:farnesol dehydrogenase